MALSLLGDSNHNSISDRIIFCGTLMNAASKNDPCSDLALYDYIAT